MFLGCSIYEVFFMVSYFRVSKMVKSSNKSKRQKTIIFLLDMRLIQWGDKKLTSHAKNLCLVYASQGLSSTFCKSQDFLWMPSLVTRLKNFYLKLLPNVKFPFSFPFCFLVGLTLVGWVDIIHLVSLCQTVRSIYAI